MATDLTEDEQQEILLAHAKDSSRRGTLPPPARTGSKNNPLCGDVVALSIRFSGDNIEEARAETQGCFICRASTSMLIGAIEYRTKDQALKIAADFRRLMHGESASEELKAAGDLVTLEGIKKYPIRIKCALLPFDVAEGLLRE